MHNTLFADSGGTGTGWVYLDSNGNKVYFDTESYHPSNWNESFWFRFVSFWESKRHLLGYTLNFYGAGCLNTDYATLIREKFESIGFSNVKIKSDLHAAGYSVHKNGKGVVIISGTGSVLFDYFDFHVTNIVGGKGHVLGDEGSGFYFGKLIIEKYRVGSLNDRQISILNELSDLSRL
ncbi:MAG: hypothetical protein HRT57_02250, partial [Crocinitomicaceae bacterium]|nr:hypothetical protein [Crocinitomicaceae bacterium]